MRFPTSDELVRLFRNSPVMRGKAVRILKAHFESPGYAVTPAELTELLSYKSVNGLNAHYGRLAKELALDFGWTEDLKNKEGVGWLYFLMDYDLTKAPKRRLILREATVKALKEFGW